MVFQVEHAKVEQEPAEEGQALAEGVALEIGLGEGMHEEFNGFEQESQDQHEQGGKQGGFRVKGHGIQCPASE